MKDRLVYFKDALVPASEALVHALSPTAQFAINVFEGIRGYWKDAEGTLLLFRLDEHLARLRESCKLMHLAADLSDSEIKDIIRAVIEGNKYREDIAIRLIIFLDGEGSWSTIAPASLTVAPTAMPRRAAVDRTPLRATVSSWRRVDDVSLPPRVKCGANYVNGRYAQLDARAKGFDVPILLGSDGRLSEAPGACLCLVRHGILVTPPPTASTLESITQDTVLQLARENGIPTEVRPIDRSELILAEEAFLCGSAAEISPIGSVDTLPLTNEVGPITRLLSTLYFKAVSGDNILHANWHWGIQVN